MSASWIQRPARHDTIELWSRVMDDALADFPSERDESVALRVMSPAHRPTGVTMKVARISPGVALGLVLVLLLGAGSAALISVLAGGRGDVSAPASFASVRR